MSQFFFFSSKIRFVLSFNALLGVFASRSLHCARMGLLSGVVDLLEGAIRCLLAPGINGLVMSGYVCDLLSISKYLLWDLMRI